MIYGTTRVALIPAYKPTDELLNLVVQLSDAHFKIVIVDDGSGEEYREIFSASKRFADVLVHEANRGKGRALKTGLAYINRHFENNPVIVTMDADGQHSVSDAIKVADAAIRSRDSLILGCRRFDGDVPARSRFGNNCTRFVYRIMTGVKVSDTQTGLRAFRAELIPIMLNVHGNRYEYEMNVLLDCSRRKIPIKEVEIKTIYFDNNSGSHFNTVKDSILIYKDIFKFAASSAASFVIDYGTYSLLAAVTAGLGSYISIPLSNITARLISSTVNYSINKRFVFENKDSVTKTATQYFTLAAVILAGNTMLLSILVNNLELNKYAAKIITEITFFTLSWFTQKHLIFGKKQQTREAEAKTE